MSNLEVSFRALRVLDTARSLFNSHGFHSVGVDRIIESSQIAKASFYKYFQSKEQLIEMSLGFQTDALKEEVFSIIHRNKGLTVHEKLKRIYVLHVNLEGLYHLPFKAIFEIEKRYPKAYKIVVNYRKWLLNQIYKLLLTNSANASKKDAHMFLFVMDGAMVLLLGGSGVDDPELLIEGFLVGVS
ncbi:TetR/AcrR family transcriptional regulator [Acinetobacter sp. ANC 3882]|uniref:TetR/AcrR family transcriptional regulator n=1 Tax=Acinetobacter sp. ANC 3882 TaxID=2923423 RepID=UPI001F4B9C15|nr:TetR/AcrR family transcriptional regulator [Acinetobacter sp. ANC 3882]MCH7315271.1 TetR/AcrR family transcriptional regulator [Acinetobacter sp. ANC 3882]